LQSELGAPAATNCHQQTWERFWLDRGPEREIRMWDFYGGRPWVMKHLPRLGKLVDAACGFGRYAFLLRQLGIDIEGIDSSERCMDEAGAWAASNGQHGFLVPICPACLTTPYRNIETSNESLKPRWGGRG
jgi:SAM-dependent methyltransferase